MTYLCVTCSKVFSTQSNLNYHVKTIHLKECNFKCLHCQKSFTQNSSLQTHIKTVHLNERNFKCPHCNKVFGRNSSLQSHIKTVHLNERNFKCPHCNKVFGRNSSLQRHINAIHLNPKLKSMSRLEQKVFEILSSLDIKFQQEVTFNGLLGVNNGHLRFDFVIAVEDSYLMIEVDGQQHENPVTFGSMTDDEAIENFETLQKHDQIKNEYCNENCYPLLRLKFSNYKYFETQLNDFLKMYYYK